MSESEQDPLDACSECNRDPYVYDCAQMTGSTECAVRACAECVETCSSCGAGACPACSRDCPQCDEALVCAICVMDLAFQYENYVTGECWRCSEERLAM